MTIIFDLDYTLLDSGKLKKKLAGLVNVEYEIYCKGYKKIFSDKKEKYSFKKHLAYLEAKNFIKKNNPDVEKFWTRPESLIKNCLYPEAESVLQKLAKKNDLFLLSYGDYEWQKFKIKNLGLKKYFKDVFVTEEEKHFYLKKFKYFSQDEEIVVVNDKEEENKDNKKIYPEFKIFQIKGPYSENGCSLKDVLCLS